MWPFTRKTEEQKAADRALTDMNARVTRALDLYESLVDLYSRLIGFFLAKCDTEDKLIDTWSFFFDGVPLDELLHISEMAGYDGDAHGILVSSVANGKYVRGRLNESGVEVLHLNMKTLVEVFFGLLGCSDGLNVLNDYLEENGLMTEDGAVVYLFYRGGDKMAVNIPAYLYESVVYDPETGSAKEGT